MLSLSKIQFKSNSQLFFICLRLNDCCAQSIKDTIQKQFTTKKSMSHVNHKLCSVYQRYNSKAIHNTAYYHRCCVHAVLSLSKIQFKSNSQRLISGLVVHLSCAQSIKDTIQKQFTTSMSASRQYTRLCSVYQRYNSKAIHNFE